MNQGVNIYLPDNHIGYLPLWPLWCSVSYQVFSWMGGNTEIWRLTIKLPLILAQFALAFAMWKFAERRFSESAGKIFWFGLTWIFFIYIGALWGQLNMLSALLTFLAFYAIISRKTAIGAILLGIAIALKTYPLIVAPAFAVYIWKNRERTETGKFLLITGAVPLIYTLAFFSAYQWDVLYLLKTVFYWAPVYDVNPTQMMGGCMNFWSFASLLNVDISQISILRFIWIPILAAAVVYWLKKHEISESDFNISVISLYVLFMLSYAWVPEQTFLDLLPFVFLQIFCYRPKKFHVLMLALVQGLVFAFSVFNWGPFIFEPLLSQFAPATLQAIQVLDPSKSSIVWTTRGVLGLAVSGSLVMYLLTLARPEGCEGICGKIRKIPSFLTRVKPGISLLNSQIRSGEDSESKSSQPKKTAH